MRFNRLREIEKKRQAAEKATARSRLSRRQWIQQRWRAIARDARIQHNIKTIDTLCQVLIFILILRVELEYGLIGNNHN